VTIVGTVVQAVCEVAFFLLLARLVFDYVFMFARNWRPSGPIVVLLELIYSVTDPPLKALRRVIPPLRLGSVSLDLGFLVLIIAVQVIAFQVAPKL
jgi:YggT family protein